MCIYDILFIHSSVDGCLGCFYFLALFFSFSFKDFIYLRESETEQEHEWGGRREFQADSALGAGPNTGLDLMTLIRT